MSNSSINHKSFRQRVAENKPSRWIRFAIVSLIFFLWVAWLGNPLVALWWFLLFDIYITGYIPFTWWKHSKNKAVRSIMSWVDAIVYALVLVYFVFLFVGQNYQIPSSSLEKTLLTGDYLWVNKMVYGPRVPITPVHFPLVHNKFMGHDSYLDKPQFEYHRLKGLRNVELGDIVVFNFPCGDSVTTKTEDADPFFFYAFQSSPDSYINGFTQMYGNTPEAARQYLVDNPDKFGELKFRPVDRRQNFVKRCVGLPGQRIKIVNDTISLDSSPMPFPENVQFNFLVTSDKPYNPDQIHKFGIADADVFPCSFNQAEIAYLAQAIPSILSAPYAYRLPLSNPIKKQLQDNGYIIEAIKINDLFSFDIPLFPQPLSAGWTCSDYGGDKGILIPKKGLKIPLTYENWLTYQRCIRNYENHPEARWQDDKVFFGDTVRDSYTFTMDYYFMMGDNRDNSQDSRFWGFVPEDHIVGTPLIVLTSFDKERSIWNGGIRWNRTFRSPNPDK